MNASSTDDLRAVLHLNNTCNDLGWQKLKFVYYSENYLPDKVQFS